jgi:nitrogenase molybdenum-iron protein beta chain
VNILFGPASEGVAEWRAIPRAKFNLVLSPWLGLDVARHLETKYGQPFLHEPGIPIGARLTGDFLRRIASVAGLPSEPAEAFIAREERDYYLYLRDFSAFYAGATSQYQLPSQFVIISESAYTLAVAQFLADQLGLVPGLQIVTENPPDTERDQIRESFANLAEGVSADVAFVEDGYLAHKLVLEQDYTGHYPIVFGSTWEGSLAAKIKAPLVEIAYPATDEVVLSRTYVGYRGALALLERTYTAVVRASTMA